MAETNRVSIYSLLANNPFGNIELYENLLFKSTASRVNPWESGWDYKPGNTTLNQKTYMMDISYY